MSTLISVKQKWAQQNLNFVFYNYLAEKKTVTIEQCRYDLQKSYSIILSKEKIRQMLLKFLQNGILNQYFECYNFIES